MILGFKTTMVIKNERKNTKFKEKIKSGVKIHTIREDSKNRWKSGKKIHFCTGVRTKNYNCFKEGLCTGIENIKIICFPRLNLGHVFIDGYRLDCRDIEELAINDGFDSAHDFFGWFEPYGTFNGKIIQEQ